MIMRRTIGAGAMVLLALVPSLVFPDPKSPVEPRPPEIIAEKTAGEADVKEGRMDNKTSFEYPAVVSYANGNRHKALIVLPAAKISATYAHNGRKLALEEDISNLRSVEFRGWERRRSKRNGAYYHSSAAVTLEDGSVFMCGNISLFNSFSLRRGKETHTGFTFFYRDTPGAVPEGKRKAAARGKGAPPGSGFVTVPHPDTVVGIRFIREEGGKGLENLLPMLLK